MNHQTLDQKPFERDDVRSSDLSPEEGGDDL